MRTQHEHTTNTTNTPRGQGVQSDCEGLAEKLTQQHENRCHAPAGRGTNRNVQVTAGGQSGSANIFHYNGTSPFVFRLCCGFFLFAACSCADVVFYFQRPWFIPCKAAVSSVFFLCLSKHKTQTTNETNTRTHSEQRWQ